MSQSKSAVLSGINRNSAVWFSSAMAGIWNKQSVMHVQCILVIQEKAALWPRKQKLWLNLQPVCHNYFVLRCRNKNWPPELPTCHIMTTQAIIPWKQLTPDVIVLKYPLKHNHLIQEQQQKTWNLPAFVLHLWWHTRNNNICQAW